MNKTSDMAQPTGKDDNKIITKLKIATFNVRGLKNNKKRFTLVRNLKLKNIDIISMQETHFNNEVDSISLSSQWGGTVHHSFGSNRSKGIATLFNPSIKDSDISLIFKNDRVLISLVNIDSVKFVIVNIYCPCTEQEKKLFLNNLFFSIADVLDANPTII